MYEMGKIIGKKIIAIKSFQPDRRIKNGLLPVYILLDDRSTVIELAEQDYYCYHDCDYFARKVIVHNDPVLRDIITNNEDGVYPDANCDL